MCVCVHLKEIPIDSGGKSLVKPQKLLFGQPRLWAADGKDGENFHDLAMNQYLLIPFLEG